MLSSVVMLKFGPVINSVKEREVGTDPKGAQALPCKVAVLFEAFAKSLRDYLYLPTKYSCSFLQTQRVQKSLGAEDTQGHPLRDLHPES